MGCSGSAIKEVNMKVSNVSEPQSKMVNNESNTNNPLSNKTNEVVLKKQKTVIGKVDVAKNDKIENYVFSEINSSSKKIKKYWRNQKPPTVGTDWKDPFFPHDFTSIMSQDKNGNFIDQDKSRRDEEGLSEDLQFIEWRKASDIFKGEFALFEGEIAVDDLKQGSLGNCYLLAAISAMADNPQMIAQMFTFFEANKGYFEVVCKIDGHYKKVLVDDYFPVDNRNGQPYFLKPNGNEVWSMILEKVWAKINGGYLNTIAGLSIDVFHCFTPFPCKYIFHDFSDTQKENDFFLRLLEADQKQYIISTSTKVGKNVSDVGLVEGHAFTFISAHEHKGVKVVKLRNPWGAREWNGDWSDSSSLWNNEFKKAFGYTGNKNDGIFYMLFKDFIKYFQNTEMCERIPILCSKMRQVKKADANKAQVTKIQLYYDSTVFIEFARKSWRFHRAILTEHFVPQTLILAKLNDSSNGYQIIDLVSESADSSLIKRDLEKGQYLLWSLADYANGHMPNQFAYNLNINASNYFDIAPFPSDSQFVLIKNMLLNEGRDYYEGQDLCEYENSSVRNTTFVVKAFVNKSLTSTYNVHVDLSQVSNISLSEDYTKADLVITPGSEFVYVGWVKDNYADSNFTIKTSKKTKVYDNNDGDKNRRYVPHDYLDLEERTVENHSHSYEFIFKELRFDFSSVIKKIDPISVNLNYFTKTLPELVALISSIDPLKKDQSKVILKDKFFFGEEDFYFGEWNLENDSRQGRGYYNFGEGSYHLGYWHNDNFNGIGKMVYGKDDWIRINFVNGFMDGEGIQHLPDGREMKLLYENDKFIKYL